MEIIRDYNSSQTTFKDVYIGEVFCSCLNGNPYMKTEDMYQQIPDDTITESNA